MNPVKFRSYNLENLNVYLKSYLSLAKNFERINFRSTALGNLAKPMDKWDAGD